MTEASDLEGSFNMSQKLLLYISKNEPLEDADVSKLLKESGEPKERIKLNIERLYEATLISGHLIHALGDRYFVAADHIKLTYEGMREIDELLKRKHGIKEVEINLGLLKFKV